MAHEGKRNRSSVHIDAIRVRAKGVPDLTARGIADGLGQAIAEALSARGITRPSLADVRIRGMDVGRVAVDGRPSAGLRAEIASRIAAAVAGRTESKG